MRNLQVKVDGTLEPFNSKKFLPLDGVAVNEGGDVGYYKRCNLDCCKQKCDASQKCNSFAFRNMRGGLCYLKDLCLSASTLAKPSRYNTYYSTSCGGAGKPAPPRASKEIAPSPKPKQPRMDKSRARALKEVPSSISGVEWVSSDTDAGCMLPRYHKGAWCDGATRVCML